MALISLDETINISMSVKDRHASAKWYESMLGFETIYHADEAGGQNFKRTPLALQSALANIPSQHLGTVFLFLGSLIWTPLDRS